MWILHQPGLETWKKPQVESLFFMLILSMSAASVRGRRNGLELNRKICRGSGWDRPHLWLSKVSRRKSQEPERNLPATADIQVTQAQGAESAPQARGRRA
jgi:hypothetical protein